jgi:NADPH-dependent glutamate synthase beta subunit-like oxidoreductase
VGRVISFTNFEIMPKPPEKEKKALTWPDWPLKLRISSSHEEGAARDFGLPAPGSPQNPHTIVGLGTMILLNARVQGADAGCCGRQAPAP